MDHPLLLGSVRNSRELGGYPGADDKKVRSGVLLRTAALNGISAEDVRKLTDELRVQHIIDFRMPMELTGADYPVIEGAEYHNLNMIDLSALPAQDMTDVDISGTDLVQLVEISEQTGMMGARMYIGFLSSDMGRAAFSEFFRILLAADPDRAVLWHCTSGKDRTGLAAMLLLSALGVSERVIVEDYLLTNEYNASRIAGTGQYLKAKGYDDDTVAKAVILFDAVDESFLSSSIEYLKKEFGSVTGYIRDGLGLSQAELDELKEKYLV